MTYPNAPTELVLKWESPLSLSQSPTIDRRNGGTEARGTNFQLNLTRETQAANVVIVTLDDYLTIEEFLQERDGKPFFFNSKLFSTLEWKWTFKGNDIFELSLSLKEEFRV